MKSIKNNVSITVFLLSSVISISSAMAADKSKADAPAPAPAPAAGDDLSGAEKINVETIKEKYWARGEETELGVVQNRTYSKQKRWELGVFGGAVLTDPFLNVQNLGFSFGYHFSEYFAVKALYWKDFSSNSAAYNQATASKGLGINLNPPYHYEGLEAEGSFLYGKLSVFGKSIIYYDMHLLGGLGLTSTYSGTYVTPHIGLGQQVYLNKHWSITLDYRFMYYHERILEQFVTNQIGNDVGGRNNFSNVITLGGSFMFGGAKEKEKGTK